MRFTKYSQGGEGVQEAVRGCHFNQSTNNEEKNKHFRSHLTFQMPSSKNRDVVS